MLWYIVSLTQTTWFWTEAWDASNDLKYADIKIKSFQDELTSHSQNNFPFARWPSLSLLTLRLCFCFDFRKNERWKEEGEQLKMLGLPPGYLLNNLI